MFFFDTIYSPIGFYQSGVQCRWIDEILNHFFSQKFLIIKKGSGFSVSNIRFSDLKVYLKMQNSAEESIFFKCQKCFCKRSVSVSSKVFLFLLYTIRYFYLNNFEFIIYNSTTVRETYLMSFLGSLS
jgi:hypothetical protein